MPLVDFATALLLAVVGTIIGYLLRALYEELSMPIMRIEDQTYPVFVRNYDVTEEALGIGQTSLYRRVTLICYRARVTNVQKALLNAAAENCIAWLDIDGVQELFQISWVGGVTIVTINVGDHRDIDFCSLAIGYAKLFAPTETGYPAYPNPPRVIGTGGHPVRGALRVTSSNAQSVSRRFEVVIPAPPSSLVIHFE